MVCALLLIDPRPCPPFSDADFQFFAQTDCKVSELLPTFAVWPRGRSETRAIPFNGRFYMLREHQFLSARSESALLDYLSSSGSEYCTSL